ncbi:agmatinase [Archaeoglobus sulfaticallidus PM70-1]|uniref:Agmatinase n=1 Tax=Archaeoglobus sulfaticallidus PM70-1 TaxID=387631 RepID=N0BEX4_9EURY|nr:agmatinase [Archaeoglobus sulfaticallidus]AGK61548.1 agmatinase [Archaeoglobus sulfaticallidus PM70-1]
MHIDSYFSLSNSDLDSAEFIIFGIPYDGTQSFKPGSRFAPNAIREASWNLESYSLFRNLDLSLVKVFDAGNVNTDGSFTQILERASEFLSKLKGFPIAIGGEHTISCSCMEFVRKKNACYLVFDAHFDLRDEFDDNPFNHACTVRRIFEKVGKVVQFGIRSGIAEERRFAEGNGIEVFYSWDILDDPKKKISELIRVLDQFDRIYVSLDMDSFDPAFAPGVSTPEPFGIHPIHFMKIISEISDRIIGFDLVEVVPDGNKVTQTLAAKLIVELISSIGSNI